MNRNILKMIEQLGYTIDYNNFRIYDKNNQELTKKRDTDGNHDRIIFVGDNGQVILFDEDSHTDIQVDGDTKIRVRNLFNERGYDSISIFFGPDSDCPELTVNYDVVKNTNPELSSGVFLSIYEDTMLTEEDDYFMGTLNIIDSNDGADISIYDKVVRHIDECTRDKYLDIIVRFISSIENEYIRDNTERSFEMIMPVFIPMIDDLIKSRDLGNSKKKQ